MGTRSGKFVTLRQLREDVGNDAARFFYVMRSNDQHLDFDLDLARERSNENPVYYVQYAHARIHQVFEQLTAKSMDYDEDNGLTNLALLTETHEKTLISSLSRYPEIIELAANNRAPQHLVHYLRDLASEFHAYYNAHVFIVDDRDLRHARLTLIRAGTDGSCQRPGNHWRVGAGLDVAPWQSENGGARPGRAMTTTLAGSGCCSA